MMSALAFVFHIGQGNVFDLPFAIEIMALIDKMNPIFIYFEQLNRQVSDVYIAVRRI